MLSIVEPSVLNCSENKEIGLIKSGPSFHLGIQEIYNLYEGNLGPFQLWLETLDKALH